MVQLFYFIFTLLTKMIDLKILVLVFLLFGDGFCGECTGAADVFMVVDASGSITDTHFQTLKNSVEGFQDNIGVTDTGVRIGIVLFSSSIHKPITDLTGDVSFLRSEIRGLPYLGGGTNTHLGINTAANELQNTGRSVPQFMVVLTDGHPSDEASTKQASTDAAAQGIIIYAVGIGPNIAQSGLEDIASDQTKVIKAVDFDVLAESLKQLSKVLCAEINCSDQQQGCNGASMVMTSLTLVLMCIMHYLL